MKKIFLSSIAAFFFTLVSGCGPKVMVPPQIDLKQYEIIGIIEFSSSAKGALGDLSTKRFVEEIRKDQGIIRVVYLGTEDEVIKSVGRNRMSPTVLKEIGKKFDVSTIFFGQLKVSDVKPNIRYSPGLGYISFSAEVEASLDVQLVETLTGASIWSSSANDTNNIGKISFFEGKNYSFDAKDPEKAYGKLVNGLVKKVTKDFKVTWQHK